MSNKTSKRFVARRILPRLVIASCLFIGLTTVWIWQPLIKQNPTRFLVHIPAEPPEQQTITQNRDLSAYEMGADFSDCTGAHIDETPQCDNARNMGRDFIWNHWKNKKRGYIVYVSTGGDTSNDIHIFIEPGKNGAWHIVQRWWMPTRGFSPNDYYEVASTESTFIKRKRTTTEEDDRLRGGKFYLIFLE